MEKEMRELYIEGVATHDDPEPCVSVREGVGEASVGAYGGRAIEPRKNLGSGCRRFQIGGRQHRSQRYASCWRTPRGRRTRASVESPCARTGRSRARPTVWSPVGPLREG